VQSRWLPPPSSTSHGAREPGRAVEKGKSCTIWGERRIAGQRPNTANTALAWHAPASSNRSVGSVHTGFGFCALAAGGSLDPHVHSFEELFYILEGSPILILDGHAVELAPGACGVAPWASPMPGVDRLRVAPDGSTGGHRPASIRTLAPPISIRSLDTSSGRHAGQR
jgi:mannose-6-phosphate isomerase-like protein (cupin superfamily)